MTYDYFYGQQSELFTFYRVPKMLFTNERFWNISADAKMLYGTAGLDPGERVRLRNFISDFSRDRIVLISTHIVSDIEYISTKNAILKDGKIVGVGTTNELVKTIDGKVWTCTVPAHKVPEYEVKLRIVNLRSEENNQVSIRYLSEQSEIMNSTPAIPRLEDLYLWLFPYEDSRKEY